MSETNVILSLLDRPIAFHRCFVTVTGSVTAALFLSQAVYWTTRTKNADGWFYKSRDQWEEETGLSRKEQETARKRLRALGILEEKQEGMDRVLWFRLRTEVLQQLLIPLQLSERGRSIGPNRTDRADSLLSTETTTETTDSDPPPEESKKTLLVPPGEPARMENFDEEFEEFWEYFPKRRGTNPKAKAKRRFLQLIREGVDPNVLICSAYHYAEAMREIGKEGTEFVQQAATFLGPINQTWRDYE